MDSYSVSLLVFWSFYLTKFPCRYFLTITSFQPLYGRLSDIFGRKAALLFAYTVFGTGCLFCGLARNLQELIAARAFAGIGGGGMTTVVSILLSDIVPLRERGTWQGYLNIIFTIGSSSGAALGGVIADSVGWRWVFLGQTPLCLVAFTAVYFCLDLPRTEESHWREKIGRVDFLGSVSLVVGIFALLVGLDHGSNVAWSDTLTIICCSITLPLFAIFIFIEMKVATYPLTPGHIIFDRSLIASYLCNFFVCLSFLACLFYIPLYLQVVEGMSASAAGVRFIPITIVGTVGSLFGGVVMQKTGKYYWLTVISFILQIFSILGILVCSALGTNYWGLLICLIVTSFGAGLAITATLINVIANSDPADQAVATASTYLFRSLGSICGVSFAGAVIQQTLRVELRKSLDSDPEADKITEHVRQSLDYIKELDPHTRELVRICYRHAETAGFAFALCTAFGGVIASWYIREKRLSK